jgi:hypothetical protein
MAPNVLLHQSVPERWTQVFAQFDGGHVNLLLQLLLIFRNHRPCQARFFHGLKAQKEKFEGKLHFLHRHAQLLQHENRAEHMRLGKIYFIDQVLLLLQTHRLHRSHGSGP